PKIVLLTFSVHLRTNMITSGHFITTFPTSLLRFHSDRRSLKVLPIALPTRPWSVGIARLKNRTLSPVVERFIAHLRDFTMPLRLGAAVHQTKRARPRTEPSPRR